MGNICRSPAAEGLARDALVRHGLDGAWATDSAGTHGYHLGHPPDRRSIAALERRDVDISDLRARRVSSDDFEAGHVILVMDDRNRSDVEQWRPDGATTPVELLMPLAGQSGRHEVADPYYEDDDAFETMARDLVDAVEGLVAALKAGRWD